MDFCALIMGSVRYSEKYNEHLLVWYPDCYGLLNSNPTIPSLLKWNRKHIRYGFTVCLNFFPLLWFQTITLRWIKYFKSEQIWCPTLRFYLLLNSQKIPGYSDRLKWPAASSFQHPHLFIRVCLMTFGRDLLLVSYYPALSPLLMA